MYTELGLHQEQVSSQISHPWVPKCFQFPTLQQVPCPTCYCPSKRTKSSVTALDDDNTKNIPSLYMVSELLELLRWAIPTKHTPPQKALHFKATPTGPLQHEMDTSGHPNCPCTALTLQKFRQEATELVLAPHFVWASTSINTGTLGPFLWGKIHFIFCQNRSVGGSLAFYSCQKQTEFVLKPCWNLQKGKKETGYEKDQINIHLQACVACIWTNHFKIPHTWELVFQFPMTSLLSQHQ